MSASYLRQQTIDKCTNWTGVYQGSVSFASEVANVTSNIRIIQDALDGYTGRWIVEFVDLNLTFSAFAYTFCDGTFVLEFANDTYHGYLVGICLCCGTLANFNINIDRWDAQSVVGFGFYNRTQILV